MMHDDFHWLGEINKASAVMLVEQGVLRPDEGRQVADAMVSVVAEAEKPGAKRPADYLEIEKLLIAFGGQEVTKVHIGRSRVDLGRTVRRLYQRSQVLASIRALLDAEQALLAFAMVHRDAIVPGYTLGVQAQPTTLGHYISGYVQVLRRGAERLRHAFDTVNVSPLGAGALATSSVPVNRRRLAELLGFAAPIDNSIDAVHFSPIDTGVELAATAASIALTLSEMLSDLEAQYRTPAPWFTITEGKLTGISSMMPQKRNPNILNALRVLCSSILGQTTTYFFMAHNVPHGVLDYSGPEPEKCLALAESLLKGLAEMFANLNFDPARALAEVQSDFAATTRLAELLQVEHGVNYRLAHHFVSELVNFGRGNGLRPLDIPHREAAALYARIAAGARLPFSAEEFRATLDPAVMALTNKGQGGPQPVEVERMMGELDAQLTIDRQWLDATKTGLRQAALRLQQAFDGLQG